jgi:AGZA family xanthine/uracil permease-like MFS transporter
MPLTFSIANGIGFGLISYAGVKILAGRFGDLNGTTLALAALFTIKYSYFWQNFDPRKISPNLESY